MGARLLFTVWSNEITEIISTFIERIVLYLLLFLYICSWRHSFKLIDLHSNIFCKNRETEKLKSFPSVGIF